MLLLLLWLPHAQAQPPTRRDLPPQLTLADSITLALQHNRTVQKALLDRVLQRYDLRVAEDEFVPNATITPFLQYNLTTPGNNRAWAAEGGVSSALSLRLPTGGQFDFIWTNSADRVENDSSDGSFASSLSLSFTQPLLKGGGIAVNTASLKISRQSEDINLLSLQATLIDVITSVILTYRSFGQAQQQLEISERALQRAQELLEVNKILIQSGRMARLDIVQTQADVADRTFNVTAAQNDFARARLLLLAVLDIDTLTPIQPVAEALRIDAVTPEFEPSLALALQYRTDYLQTLIQLDITKTSLLLAKNNRLWDLSLNAGADFNGADSSARDTLHDVFDVNQGTYRVGLDLTIPFGDLTLKQTYLNAKIGLEKSEIDLKELQQSIELQVRNAVREVATRLRQIGLAQQSRDLTEQKLEIEREKLKRGLSTNFQLVSFEDDLVRAQSTAVDATIAYLNALTALDQTLGTTLATWKVEMVEEQR